MRTSTMLLLSLLVWAVPLRADHLHVDFDQHTDFSTLKTFALRQGKVGSAHPELGNSLVVKKVGDMVRLQLALRGLKETADNPDIVVDYTVSAEEIIDHRGGPVTSMEGTLVIDLVQRPSGALVWRAVYRDSEKNSGRLAEKLPDDARKALTGYPPRQKGPVVPGPSTLAAAVLPPSPRGVATAALEVIESIRSDTSFLGPNAHPGLSISLSGLERVARAVTGDDGSSAAATANRQNALRNAIKESSDYADSIADRQVEAPGDRAKARALAARLRSLSGF